MAEQKQGQGHAPASSCGRTEGMSACAGDVPAAAFRPGGGHFPGMRTVLVKTL